MVKDLEGFGELGKGKHVEPVKEPEKVPELHNKDQDKSSPRLGPAVEQTEQHKEEHDDEAKKAEEARRHDAELDDDYDTVSIDSFVLV
jgi:hypothetical protein